MMGGPLDHEETDESRPGEIEENSERQFEKELGEAAQTIPPQPPEGLEQP